MGRLQTPRPSATVVQLADYRVPSHQRRAAERRQQPVAAPGAWARMAQARAALLAGAEPLSRRPAPHAVQPVRVTHFDEAANAQGPAPRLRICGRLADVCAELERLAAAEARQAALPRRA